MKTYKEKYFKWENIPDNLHIIITPNGYGKKYYELQKKYNKQKIILDKIEATYKSMLYSAPENMYIFIEQLGELLEELK